MKNKNHSSQNIWITFLPHTPAGPLWIAVSDAGLAAIEFGDDREALEARLRRRGFAPIKADPEKVAPFAQQVVEYLAGQRKAFDFPIDWRGMTPFQQQVLRATAAIPYGATGTYAEIAAQVGRPLAARAVGRAEATNPIPLVLPCHRVVGTDGKLHGYGGPGGIALKSWLLALESGEGDSNPRE